MTSKHEFTEKWESPDHTDEERRARLNELGAKIEKDADEQREHDALATLVAEDEAAVARGEEK